MCVFESIWSFAFNVTRWIITTNHKHPAISTLSPSTAKMTRISPNDLSIMKALVIDASVGVVVVVGLLSEPELDGVRALHVPIALSNVLTKGPARVL